MVTADFSADPGPLLNLSPDQQFYLDFLQRLVKRDRYFLNFNIAKLIFSTLNNVIFFYKLLLHTAMSFTAYIYTIYYTNSNLSKIIKY